MYRRDPLQARDTKLAEVFQLSSEDWVSGVYYTLQKRMPPGKYFMGKCQSVRVIIPPSNSAVIKGGNW